MDEETEWDMRLHNDFLIEHLGFAGWIQGGIWGSGGKTPHGNHAPTLQREGGWQGFNNISHSSYWALEDKWLYMMGDSTKRQVWATMVSPFQSNDFERNAKEWTREKCDRQYPHRKEHPAGGYFHQEGWGGNCGNNEVTCNLSGYGKNGIVTFDWKHFPWEDYDEWLFGPDGHWGTDTSKRRPDILTFQVGLHTCFHAYNNGNMNETMIENHTNDLPILMKKIREAIERPNDAGVKTTVRRMACMLVLSSASHP
jgi:hypothetical protein